MEYKRQFEFSVEVTVDAFEPLTQATLEELAALGGVAGGAPGARRYDVTMTVESGQIPTACSIAIDRATAIAPGVIVAVEAMTTEEADRRLDAPAFPKLAGVSEVAERLGITKQRLAVLRQREDFPAPVAELTAGPVWRIDDLSTFAGGWQRRAGRPPTRARVEFRKGSEKLTVTRRYPDVQTAAAAALRESDDQMAIAIHDGSGKIIWERKRDRGLAALDALAKAATR